MEKKQILLPSKRYFKAKEEDLTLNVKLEGDSVLMRQGERDILLDLPTLFDDERNESKRYKIYGKIKMVFRNMYSGTTDYTPLLKNFYLTNDGSSENKKGFIPYNEFALLRNDVLREDNIIATGSTLGTFIPQVQLTGARYTGHTSISPIQAPYKNWNLYLTYVYGQDSTYPMNYSLSGGTSETCDGVINHCFTAGDGIPFRVESIGNYYSLTSPIEHGMSKGEYIILSATTLTTDFWVSGKTYSKDNIVRYLDKLYTSKINSNSNNVPQTNGGTYWKLVTNYSPTETYDINNLVFYSGKTYKSLITPNLNKTPPITGTTIYWEVTSGKQFYTLPLTPDTEKYRIFQIDNVGNETYNSEKYVINILRSEFTSETTLNQVIFGRRCLDLNNITGSTSSYYVHKHKTLTTEEDYILDKVGFESPIWENERKILFESALKENDVLVERNRPESVLFDFKKTFILTGITNNLKYTPTEVYATMILRNGNGFFTYPPKVGYKFNFHDKWVDYQFNVNRTGTTETSITKMGFTSNTGLTGFTSGNTISTGTTLTGAFVEYNEKELKERIISEAFHRFSHIKTLSDGKSLFNHEQDQDSYYAGVTSGNTVGYYYQPHHRIKLRQLSPYIETSKLKREELINLPENTIFDGENKVWKWRDVYDHGFIDQEGNGTKFPYINDMHYVSTDINFYLRNERGYNNKTDGLTGFNNQIIC